MDFVLLLAVFVISPTAVLTRPFASEQSNKRKMEFLFPTQINDGFTLIINGTMKSANKTLEVELPNNDEDFKCTYSYDFQTKKIRISPALESEEVIYDVNDTATTPNCAANSAVDIANETDCPDSKPEFSLMFRATTLGGLPMFKLTLDINESGNSEPLACSIPAHEGYSRIVFNEEVEAIKSLLFKFSS